MIPEYELKQLQDVIRLSIKTRRKKDVHFYVNESQCICADIETENFKIDLNKWIECMDSCPIILFGNQEDNVMVTLFGYFNGYFTMSQIRTKRG